MCSVLEEQMMQVARVGFGSNGGRSTELSWVCLNEQR